YARWHEWRRVGSKDRGFATSLAGASHLRVYGAARSPGSARGRAGASKKAIYSSRFIDCDPRYHDQFAQWAVVIQCEPYSKRIDRVKGVVHDARFWRAAGGAR